MEATEGTNFLSNWRFWNAEDPTAIPVLHPHPRLRGAMGSMDPMARILDPPNPKPSLWILVRFIRHSFPSLERIGWLGVRGYLNHQDKRRSRGHAKRPISWTQELTPLSPAFSGLCTSPTRLTSISTSTRLTTYVAEKRDAEPAPANYGDYGSYGSYGS
jgi:hypothetical protein